MENDNSSDAFSNLLAILFARKLIFIIGFLSIIITTIVGTSLMPPTYKATAKIYINLPAIPKAEIPYLTDLRSEPAFVRNQKEVIESRFIYEKVAKDLRLDQEKKQSSFISKFFNTFFQTKQSSASKKYPLEDAIRNLYKKTIIELVKGTNIIKITAYSRSPEKAAEIANSIAKTYIDYTNEILFTKAQGAYGFISAQLETSRKELTRSQQVLNDYKQREDVLSLTAMEDEIAQTRIKLNEYDMEYQQILGEIEAVENQLSQKNIDSSGLKDEDMYQIKPDDTQKVRDLKTRLIDLNNQLNAAEDRYTSEHPAIVQLRGQIAKLREELSKEIGLSSTSSSMMNSHVSKSKLNDLKSRRDTLHRQILVLNVKLRGLSKNEDELTRLTQDVNSKESEYLSLKQELENASMLKANEMQEGSIRALDKAFPSPYPETKKKKVLLAIGFFVSMLFGMGMAFLAEYLDDSLKSSEETQKYLGLPLLATIPPITRKMRKENDLPRSR